MFNDKISQRNYPVRAGYCASYYLCANSHWHPRALVMPSAAAPNLSSDKDIPWLVSWAIASFTKYVSGGKPGPVHRTMGKSPASCSTWAFFFSLTISSLAHLN